MFIRRRRLLGAGMSLAALALARGATAALAPTPPQTAGPFYPAELPLEHDADLVQIAGHAERAKGTVTHVFGHVLDLDGRALHDALVEIWQCDAFGRYHHTGRGEADTDPDFQGYGRTRAAADGGFRFRTIRPVPYPGRTPHIHFAVTVPGASRFTTQLYVRGEPRNAHDWILNSVRDRAARESLIVPFEPAPEIEPGALGARFDIVLGRNATS
jgi:protocatechuate 3,4-dioxygenase beta subunit